LREVLCKLLIALRDLFLCKTRIQPVPGARQTADPLASCPPKPVRSPPRWPPPSNPDTSPVLGITFPQPESRSGWPAQLPR
jgi:hypothetical protein